ncbi:MAG: hydantoinase B/oxoprolinase family protein [Hyphomicrobiales bacterium]
MSLADPIKLSLLQNRLDHIARQMGWVMVRTSRSPIFNQSHDFSCFITDGAGTLVSQADGIPIHTGGGGFAVRALIAAFAGRTSTGRISEGDAFLLNDPYVAGGNHLPDWVIARPVFARDRLVAFTCNRAHQSDIGGGAAGTYNTEATEIFHEGIRLPPMKLVEGGVVREDVWRMLLLNTRCPELLDGDLRAMLGATQVGAREIERTVQDTGPAQTVALFEDILDHADRRMREAIARLPDGVYEAQEHYETDCFVERKICLKLTLTKRGDSIHVDFTGTDPQIRGFKNSSLANTYSAVYAAVSSFFDSDLPRNEGTFRAIEILAPEGTLVNARPPAPLTMCTVFPAHEIMHMVWWALGQADEDRAIAGWGKSVFPVTSGLSDRGMTWVMYNWGGGSGAGAVLGRDGFNQMGPMVTLGGLVIPNAETYEQLYPVTVHRHEFHIDGGGLGRFRGGSGICFDADILTEAQYSLRGEGIARPTGLGVAGAGAGAQGRMELTESGRAPVNRPAYAVLSLGPAHLSITSPGGGGFGDPFERDLDAVLRDVRDGIVSPEAAERDYGVVICADGKHVDPRATQERRRAPPSLAPAQRGGRREPASAASPSTSSPDRTGEPCLTHIAAES